MHSPDYVNQRGFMCLKGQIKGLVDNTYTYMCVMQLVSCTPGNSCADCKRSCCLSAQSLIKALRQSRFSHGRVLINVDVEYIYMSVQIMGGKGPTEVGRVCINLAGAEKILLVYSGWGCGAGVSLALLSVILFSSSSSDKRSKELPSTWIGRLPERLEEKLIGPPRLQRRQVCLSKEQF